MLGRLPTWTPVLLVLTLGTLLRFIGLTRESLWNDELSTMSRLLPGPLSESYWEMIAKDCHPPGYLLFMSAWTSVFGNSELALRAPSALAGSATPLAVFFLGQKCFGRSAGVSAAMLCAVSPMLVRFSQEARSYAIVTLLTTVFAHQLLTLLSFDNAPAHQPGVRRSRLLRVVVPTSIAGALCSLVHYSGLLTVASLGAFAWAYVFAVRRKL